MKTWLEDVQDATFAGASAATTGSFGESNRLSGEQLVKVLTTRRNAVVSTTRKDGRPHSTPCAFVLHERSIWLPVVPGAARAKHVARQPWISLVISEGQLETHGTVIIEGAAFLAEPGGDVLAAAKAKLGGVGWVGQWIELKPERILSYASPAWKEDGV
jgi:pyridoxamine 5'-phosphate oxidase-like protein